MVTKKRRATELRNTPVTPKIICVCRAGCPDDLGLGVEVGVGLGSTQLEVAGDMIIPSVGQWK